MQTPSPDFLTWLDQAKFFAKQVLLDAEKAGIFLASNWMMDHLCFRVASTEDYITYQKLLKPYGSLLSEEHINGRPISTYLLHKPFWVESFLIDTIELPYPKAGTHYDTGFEHAEFVVDQAFSTITATLKDTDLQYSLGKNAFNRELKVKLNEKTQIKFHHMSLHSVTRLENHTPAQVREELNAVLATLEKKQPLLVGTYPLGLQDSSSDFDILIHSENHVDTSSALKELFGSKPCFQQATEADYILTSFRLTDGHRVEVFASATPPYKQRAFKHFLVEEKLLKVLDKSTTQEIRNLRGQALKTEPAFVQALGEDVEDPFEFLEILSTKSEKQLFEEYA